MKVKKTAIIGTHSAGKSTLSYMLAAHYKKLGKSVKIIQEVARSCPYPLNEGMTKEACLWIYHEHVKKELEAIQKFDTIICDRSAIDSFMYAKAQYCFDSSNRNMHLSFKSAESWMTTYDQIIYVEPGNIQPVADGVRSTDLEFQSRVQEQFKWFLESEILIEDKLVKITANDIFEKTNLMESLIC